METDLPIDIVDDLWHCRRFKLSQTAVVKQIITPGYRKQSVEVEVTLKAAITLE